MKDEILIDGIKYINEDIVHKKIKETVNKNKTATDLNGLNYCIVRTYSAGVFAGYVEKRKEKEVWLKNSRRIWYWAGANSLSQLAKDGTAKPNECKFAVEIEKTLVTEAIEIIFCTEKARLSIQGVEEWKM